MNHLYLPLLWIFIKASLLRPLSFAFINWLSLSKVLNFWLTTALLFSLLNPDLSRYRKKCSIIILAVLLGLGNICLPAFFVSWIQTAVIFFLSWSNPSLKKLFSFILTILLQEKLNILASLSRFLELLLFCLRVDRESNCFLMISLDKI